MRRLATATLAGLTVFGLVNGLAASMTVTGDQLGSDANVVTAACDDAMTMAFGVTAGNAAEVSTISFSGVDASCDGQKVYIDVLDGSGVATSEEDTVSLSGGAFAVTLTTPQPAASVVGANVTITGPDATP